MLKLIINQHFILHLFTSSIYIFIIQQEKNIFWKIFEK